MYKCKHFELWELVPPSIINQYGDQAWEFLDERALRTLDKLRDKFGVCIINDYGFSREFLKKIGRENRRPDKYSGYRPISCRIGAANSQHRHGRAFDCDFIESSTDNVRQYIIDHPKEFRYITGLELKVPWLHFDTRNHKGLFLFSP